MTLIPTRIISFLTPAPRYPLVTSKSSYPSFSSHLPREPVARTSNSWSAFAPLFVRQSASMLPSGIHLISTFSLAIDSWI